jgi:hypothetical protein
MRQQIEPVDVDLIGLVADRVALLGLRNDLRRTSAARNVGNQSWCWMISLETTPAGILPGHRISSGTRKAPSQLEFFSLRNGVIPASGQLFMCGPLSVEYTTMVSSAMPS